MSYYQQYYVDFNQIESAPSTRLDTNFYSIKIKFVYCFVIFCRKRLRPDGKGLGQGAKVAMGLFGTLLVGGIVASVCVPMIVSQERTPASTTGTTVTTTTTTSATTTTATTSTSTTATSSTSTSSTSTTSTATTSTTSTSTTSDTTTTTQTTITCKFILFSTI